MILAELQREEARFLETLERGEKLLADVLAAKPKQISGEQAFELYDTYGFPLELTEEIAEEHGLSVDLEGFEAAMEAQRQRAKAAAVSIDLTLQEAIDQVAADLEATAFRGYELLEHSSSVLALVVNGEPAQRAVAGDSVQVVLDTTPFYGEGGGQVGDRGVLSGDGPDGHGLIVAIEAVSRNRSVFVHSGRIERGVLSLGDVVHGQVDRACRRRAQANHSATHLLQAALKQVVDPGIGQAGSLVDFDRLRFDFHCPRAVSAAELEQIESLINGWISEAHSLEVRSMAIETAKAAGAVAMFGEKYADVVRVVDVPGVSMELCGGTHVANTAEIGLFKIVSESGVAAGIRRIEAVAGPAVLAYLNERDGVVKQLGERFKAQPAEIVDRVAQLADELKASQKALAAAREELALAKSAALAGQAVAVGEHQLLVARLDGVEGGGLQSAAQGLVDQLGDGAAVVLGGLPDPTRSGQGDPGGGLRQGRDRGRPQGRSLHRWHRQGLRWWWWWPPPTWLRPAGAMVPRWIRRWTQRVSSWVQHCCESSPGALGSFRSRRHSCSGRSQPSSSLRAITRSASRPIWNPCARARSCGASDSLFCRALSRPPKISITARGERFWARLNPWSPSSLTPSIPNPVSTCTMSWVSLSRCTTNSRGLVTGEGSIRVSGVIPWRIS